MPDIDIQAKDKRFYFIKFNLKQFCRQVVAAGWQKKNEPAEISVVLTSDEMIHKLNKAYRHKDKPTNVLTFATGTAMRQADRWLAGDIVIAYETLCREAKEQKKSPKAHLAHLLTHGVFHLQGYDHQTAAQARVMERGEIKTMQKLGFENPYREA